MLQKKFIFGLLLTFGLLSQSFAQSVVRLTPRSNFFLVGLSSYPLNTVAMVVDDDSINVALWGIGVDRSFSKPIAYKRPYSYYADSTGATFGSLASLRSWYNSYMVGGGGGSGVSSITAGIGLTGGTITSTGTIALYKPDTTFSVLCVGDAVTTVFTTTIPSGYTFKQVSIGYIGNQFLHRNFYYPATPYVPPIVGTTLSIGLQEIVGDSDGTNGTLQELQIGDTVIVNVTVR